MSYRGVSIETGKTVFGYHAKVEGKHYIIPDDAEILDCCPNGEGVGGFVEVHSQSIAQSTGVLDKNNKMIYGSIEVDGVMSEGGDVIILSCGCCHYDIKYSNDIAGFWPYNDGKGQGHLKDINVWNCICEITASQFKSKEK